MNRTLGYRFGSDSVVLAGDREGLEYPVGDDGVDSLRTRFPSRGYRMASHDKDWYPQDKTSSLLSKTYKARVGARPERS